MSIERNKKRYSSRQNKKIEFWRSVDNILKNNNRTRVGGSVASHETSQAKKKIIIQFLKQLKPLGFQLSTIQDLKERHVIAIAKHWELQKLSPSTIQTRMSVLRVLCNQWLKKPGMIKTTEYYFSATFNVGRSSITKTDKSWAGNNIIFEEVIKSVINRDPRVALQLIAMEAFGLRKKEAIMFQPHISDELVFIKIMRGAKTGKKRDIPIIDEHQRQVLDFLRKSINPGNSLGNPKKTLLQNLRRFDYVMLKVGITKAKLGVTSHGLRHGYAKSYYTMLSEILLPFFSDAIPIYKGADRQARAEVAEWLGHSRIGITNAYFGKASTK